MHKEKIIKFDSEFFNIYELNEGVYAVIDKGYTGSNSGIINLGNYTVIFDTFVNIDAANELKKAAEKLTGRAPDFVINSHSHIEHIVGNNKFLPKAKIVTSKIVSEDLFTIKTNFEVEREQYKDRIRGIKEAMEIEQNEIELSYLKNDLFYSTNLSKPNVVLVEPELTFEKEITLSGNKRNLKLIAFDNSHSSSDIIGYLPDEGICFMGDLLSVEFHSWLGSGNPEVFLSTLNKILNYNNISHYIPGHGRLASKDDVILQIQYINEIINLIKRNDLGVSIDDLSPVFRQWKSPYIFDWNINTLFDKFNNNEAKSNELI